MTNNGKEQNIPRGLDHLVHAVRDLGADAVAVTSGLRFSCKRPEFAALAEHAQGNVAPCSHALGASLELDSGWDHQHDDLGRVRV